MDAIRCPQCLEELEYLHEPRVLPCSHIFCLPCLETLRTVKVEDSQPCGEEIHCTICSKSHKIEGFIRLPMPNKSTDTEKPSHSETCDKCKDSTTADRFCVECNKKLCSTHKDIHEDYFCEEDNKHQLISIEEFLSRPDYFKKVHCETHTKEPYAMCCKECYDMACPKCGKETNCINPYGKRKKHHSYQPLRQTVDRLRDEFHTQLKKCSEAITQTCKDEKKACQTLDDLEVECDELTRQVQTKADALVQKVQEEATLYVNQILEYKMSATTHIETTLQTLVENRENLEDVKAESIHFIENNNAVDFIKGSAAMTDRLSTHYTQQSCASNRANMQPLKSSLNGFLEVEIMVAPRNLHLVSTHTTEKACFSAHFNKDGKLLISSGDSVHTYSPELMKIEEKLIPNCEPNHITAVVSAYGENETYFLSQQTDRRVVGYTTDREPWVREFEFAMKGVRVSQLAVSPEYIVTTRESSLVLYHRVTNRSMTRSLSQPPRQVLFDHTNCLLVSFASCVKKYRIKNKVDELLELWSCDVYLDYSLTIMKHGMIVAANKEVLFIISEQGQVLREIKHASLAETGGQIAVKGNTLIMPGLSNKKFLKFHLL